MRSLVRPPVTEPSVIESAPAKLLTAQPSLLRDLLVLLFVVIFFILRRRSLRQDQYEPGKFISPDSASISPFKSISI
jgi:hypothetical protein